MQGDMNALIRRGGNRARTLPDIGQTPAVLGQSPATQAMQAPVQQMPPPPPTPQRPLPPMSAPAIQPATFSLHPPGSAADPNQYNYEPQPDGSWRVYPPGIAAPAHTVSASMPRAASTADYRRLHAAFQAAAPQPQRLPTPPAPNQAPLL